MAAGEGGEEKDWKRKKRKSVNLEVELERLDFFFQPCPHPLSLPLVSLFLFSLLLFDMISSSLPLSLPQRASRPSILTPRTARPRQFAPQCPRRRTRGAAGGGEGGGGGEPEVFDASSPSSPTTTPSQPPQPQPSQKPPRAPRRAADSTDPIASALTRRFGVLGGLGWAAILTGGVLSEQIKTRIEESAAEKATVEASGELAAPRLLARGVTVRDVRIGGGAPVSKGMLLLLNVKARVVGGSGSGSGNEGSGSENNNSSGSPSPSSSSSSSYFIDTSAPGAKPLVLLFGTKLSGGICPGAELALSDMRAGGRRIALVPAAAGFGGNGFTAKPTEHVPEKRGEVPPGADLEYDIEVVRVSVPPS